MEVSLLFPECKLKPQTTAGAVGDIDVATVELYGMLDNGESQSCASHSAWTPLVNAVETLEKSRQLFRIYSASVIFKPYPVEFIIVLE